MCLSKECMCVYLKNNAIKCLSDVCVSLEESTVLIDNVRSPQLQIAQHCPLAKCVFVKKKDGYREKDIVCLNVLV